MNKVFNYIRVSSKEQNEQRQIEAMNKFNEDNNITKFIINIYSLKTKEMPSVSTFNKLIDLSIVNKLKHRKILCISFKNI